VAGLSLSIGGAPPTAGVLKLQDANAVVTVSLSAGDWGDYSIADGSNDGWYIYGPQHHIAALALSGSATALENKTFTPDVSGHYVIVLLVHNSADEQVRLSALFEVGTAYADIAILAPQERDEYEYAAGWAKQLQETALSVHKLLGGRKLVRYKNTGAELLHGRVIAVDGYLRAYGAAGDTSPSYSFLTDVVARGYGVDATADLSLNILAINIGTTAAGGFGTALIDGPLPMDTTGMTAGQDLYVTDAGIIGNAAGTNERKCGLVQYVANALVATSPSGAIMFAGAPVVATAAPAAVNAPWVVLSSYAHPSLSLNVDPWAGSIDEAIATYTELLLFVVTPSGHVLTATIPTSSPGLDSLTAATFLLRHTGADYIEVSFANFTAASGSVGGTIVPTSCVLFGRLTDVR